MKPGSDPIFFNIMHFEKYLHNGIKLLKRKNFLEAIQNLEEYIAQNDTNYLGHYYLGLAYIFRELYDEAHKYISKAYQLNENDINTINTLAFLNLKHNNVDEAINYWLDILDIDKKNYIAKRNLEKIKKTTNIEKLSSSASPDEFINFKLKKSISSPFKLSIFKFPRFPGFSRPKSNYLKIASLVIFSALIVILIYKYTINQDKIQIKKFNIPSPKNLQALHLPDLEDDYMIDKNIKKSIFNLKPEEIKNLFYNTKILIQKQYHNKAVVNINKVLHSNAGIIIKERFLILKRFTQIRKTFEIKDNISYSTLMNLPVLYEDVQVVWKGKIEDINIDEDTQSTLFNMFVREKNQTAGMARIIFNKILANLASGQEAIISGKFLKIDEKNRYPIIDGIGIKKQ